MRTVHDGMSDYLDEAEITPLQRAAYLGNLQVCQQLIEHGADLNYQEPKCGYTALMFAALNGNAEVVQLLLDNGSRTSATNSMNYNAAQMARVVGNLQISTTIDDYISVDELPASVHEELEFQRLLNQITMNPVRIAMFIRENMTIFVKSSVLIQALRDLCSRFMTRKSGANERLAIKMHVFAEILEEITKLNKSDERESDGDKMNSDFTGRIDEFVKRMLTPSKSSGCLFGIEQLLRRAIQRFPYLESSLLQSLVHQLTTQRGDLQAPSVTLQTLTNSIFTHLFSAEELACAACGDVFLACENRHRIEDVSNENSLQARLENGSNRNETHYKIESSARRLRKCAACRVTQYCSVTCQRAHWFSHKQSCLKLRFLRENEENDSKRRRLQVEEL